MDIEIFTLCDFAQDNSGKLLIIGVFDIIHARILPAIHPTCHIAARIRFRSGETGSIPFEIKITSPDGDNLIPPIGGGMQIQLTPGAESTCGNICVGIGGLPLKVFGRHTVTLSLRGQELRSLPLFVVPVPDPNN
jgi:hypothetical protein